jgi:predicted RNase H-like nuclease (RuvC/YqgF family)
MSDSNKNPKDFTAKEAFSQEFDPPKTQSPQTNLDDILKKIQQAAQTKGLGANLPIAVYDSKSLVFKGVPGRKPDKNIVHPTQAKLLEKTLETPQNLKGSLRIYVGQEKVFHVKNGQVLADTLGLARQQQAQKDSPQVESSPTPALSSEQRIAFLEQQIKQQQQQINRLTRHLENLNQTTPKLADPSLGNWFQNLYAQLQDKGKNLIEQLSQSLQQKKEMLMVRVREFITDKKEWADRTQENLLTQVEATRNSMQLKTGEFATGTMIKATQKVADLTGEKFTSLDNLNKYAIPADHYWKLYSDKAMYFREQSGSQPLAPAQLTVAAAQYALQDGLSKRSVLAAIESSPDCRRIKAQQGEKQARQYAELALAKATRLERQGKQPQLQTAQQQSIQQAKKRQNEPGF